MNYERHIVLLKIILQNYRYMRHIFSLFFILYAFSVYSQDNYDARALQYVSQYYKLAIEEQQRTGIPAAITLAQGIIETDAGTSELMTNANNHFGIKCKNDWKGETYLHTDDLPNECFKKYKCAEDSYKDHSDHLKRNQRYAPLFKIKITDYKAWANGLKKCGYATSPIYANKLIKAVEDYKLQDYTLAAINNTPITPPAPPPMEATHVDSVAPIALQQPDPIKKDSVMQPKNEPQAKLFSDVAKKADSAQQIVANMPPPAMPKMDTPKVVKPIAVPVTDINAEDKKYDRGNVITANGLKAFYAHKGESLLTYAVKYNVRYVHLLEMNDLPDAPLSDNMLIYLEKKLPQGTTEKHIVKENETLLLIAQEEGIQLKKLMGFNMLDDGEEPAIGVTLELQYQATHKPDLRSLKQEQVKNMSLADIQQPASVPSDYVPVNKPKVTDSPAMAKTVQPEDTTVTDDSEEEIATPLPAKAPVKINVTPATPKEDLTKLKADMDKMVYAKDSGIVLTTDFSGGVGNKPAKPVKQPKPAHAAEPKKGAKYYTIRKGDTLFDIADKYDVTVKELEKWNKITPHSLRPGQKIKIKD